jgi:hypothetical protein
MKPLNLDNSPCSPISSNCVIWQGPDIPCIKLCTGDTITDVVYALALQLCNIVDQVNISTLDLACLNITTGTPTNINDLLQILINKICELNNVQVPSGRTITDSCPTNCIVNVAECLRTGTQTTMKLLDYVQLIGNELCSIITQINSINSSISNLTTRVEALESIPPTPAYILPSIVPDCTLADGSVIAGNSYQLNIILEALINDDNHGYCALLGALGQPAEIEIAYNGVPVDGVDISLAACPLTLEQYFAGFWITSPSNLSESFTNLWLVVKDLRDAYLTYNVVAGNSNVTVTSSTVSSTCPDVKTFSVKAKGTTVAAGDNITVDVDTTDPDNTIYTVNNEGLDTFIAHIIINSTRQPFNGVINTNTPGIGVAIGEDMVMLQKYNLISVNNVTTDAPAGAGAYVSTVTTLPFGTFDNVTGEVTITTTGTYLITGTIQLKSAETNFPIWQTSGIGSFHLGILSNSNNVFTGDSQHVQGPMTLAAGSSPLTIPGIHTTISLTSSVQATCGPSTVVRLGIFNFTDRNYNGNTYSSGDIIRFAITRLR